MSRARANIRQIGFTLAIIGLAPDDFKKAEINSTQLYRRTALKIGA